MQCDFIFHITVGFGLPLSQFELHLFTFIPHKDIQLTLMENREKQQLLHLPARIIWFCLICIFTIYSTIRINCEQPVK